MKRRRPARVSIAAAKRVAKECGMTQVVVVGWDGKTGNTWVATYGVTLTDCEQAAVLGNKIKRQVLAWPEELCEAKPARVRRKEKLDPELERLKRWLRSPNGKRSLKVAIGDVRTDHPPNEIDPDYASRGR